MALSFLWQPLKNAKLPIMLTPKKYDEHPYLTDMSPLPHPPPPVCKPVHALLVVCSFFQQAIELSE